MAGQSKLSESSSEDSERRDRSPKKRTGFLDEVVILSWVSGGPILGLSVKRFNKRMLVAKMEPGSVSEQCLKIGDIIVDIDGKRVRDKETTAELLVTGLRARGKVRMNIERPVSRDAKNWALHALTATHFKPELDDSTLYEETASEIWRGKEMDEINKDFKAWQKMMKARRDKSKKSIKSKKSRRSQSAALSEKERAQCKKAYIKLGLRILDLNDQLEDAKKKLEDKDIIIDCGRKAIEKVSKRIKLIPGTNLARYDAAPCKEATRIDDKNRVRMKLGTLRHLLAGLDNEEDDAVVVMDVNKEAIDLSSRLAGQLNKTKHVAYDVAE